MRQLLPVLLILVSGCSAGGDSSSSRQVLFAIDLTEEIHGGRFNPLEDAVGVRGSMPPLSWSSTARAADPDGDGVYEALLGFEPDADSLIQYKFKIDSEGDPGAGWEEGRNRRAILSASLTEVRRAFNAPVPDEPPSHSGDIRHYEGFPSLSQGFPREFWVYLPPNYDAKPDRRYPVLYLHDGQNMFDHRSAGAEWRMDEAAETLIASAQIEPVIMVAVAHGPNRTEEYTPAHHWRHMLQRSEGAGPGLAGVFDVENAENGEQLKIRLNGGAYEAMLPGSDFWQPIEGQDDGTYIIPGPEITLMITDTTGGFPQRMLATRPPSGGGGDAYGRFLIEELKPFIDATYRTMPGRSALGGSSLGGLITMMLGARYPAVFEGLLVVSPSAWWGDGMILDMVADTEWTSRPKIWLDMGTEEGGGMLRGSRGLRAALLESGWEAGDNLAYVEADGATHSETAWARRTPDMLKFLYGM